MIDKEPWQRQDLTKFNKIYRWDVVYKKIIELIFQSNHLSALNLQDKQKVQQSSFILKHGLVDMKEQIQQKQELYLILKNLEFHKLKVQEMEQQYNDLLEQQQIQSQNQFSNQQFQQTNYQDKDKVKLTPELMVQKNRLQQILGQLILKDLQEQKNSGKNLHKDLNQIFSQLQQGQDCDKKDIIDLYKKHEGRIYLKKYITGKNIAQFISGEYKQISQILHDMSVFKVQLDRELKNRK